MNAFLAGLLVLVLPVFAQDFGVEDEDALFDGGGGSSLKLREIHHCREVPYESDRQACIQIRANGGNFWFGEDHATVCTEERMPWGTGGGGCRSK